MSSLLLSWMNDELQLSSEVMNFETDFSNGYLVGEILHRFNQQKNFHKFMNKQTADAKINNWCLLSPIINALAVKFDSKCAYSIMCQQKGYASKLLYQIKMSIDKLSKTAPVATRPKDSAVPLCNMPMRPQKPMFDAQGQKFFEKSIRMLVENPNDVMLARTQERFVSEKLRQDQFGAQMQRDEEDFLLMRNEDRRQMRLQQTKREHDFLQDWQAKGAEDWAVNQAIANEREAKKMRAQSKVQQDRYDKQANGLYQSTSEMRNGIDDFEERLRSSNPKRGATELPPAPRSRIIDGPETGEELIDRLENELPDAKTMAIEAGQFLGRVKNKCIETSDLQSARARRRRQFIAEQRASQQEAEETRLLSIVQNDLLKGSCIEEQLGVDLWKINQYKSIIVENRNYREVQYAERRAQDHAEALERDSAACNTMVTEHEEEVSIQQERYSEVLQAKEVAAHERAKQACVDVLGEMLNLALSMAHHREITNVFGEEFPHIKWEEMKRLFVAGQAPVPAKDAPLTERLATLNPLQLEDYLNNKGLWSPDAILSFEDSTKAVTIERPKKAEAEDEGDDKGKKGKGKDKGKKGKGKKEEKVEEETAEDGDAADEGPSREEREQGILPELHYDIGDLMQKIRVQAMPLDEPPAAPDVPQCNLAICMYGQEYVGKSLHARRLAEKWDLSVIEVDELLRKAMEAYENEPDGGYPVPPEPEVPEEEEVDPAEAEAAAEFAAEAAALGEVTTLSQLQAEADAEAGAEEGAEEGAEASAEASAEAGAEASGEEGAEAAAVEEEPEPVPVDPNVALAAFSAVGKECRDILMSGQAIDDTLYAKLVALQVKHVCDEDKGWVLADFPETAQQARELERELTGYDENVKLPAPSDRKSKILPPTPGQPVDPDINLPSGVHLVFQMEGEKEELLHRALGRRVDPVTGTHYHLVSDPPPEDEVCKERLETVEVSAVTPDDAAKCMVDLSARLAVHDYGTKELEDWLQQFGSLRRVDTLGLSADEVFDILDVQVQEVVDGRSLADKEQATQMEAQRDEVAAMEAEKMRVVEEAESAVAKAKEGVEECQAVVTEYEEKVTAAPKGAEKKEAEAELASKQELQEAAEAEVVAAEARVTAIADSEEAEEKARLDALRPEPKVPDELAKHIATQWDNAEETFKAGMAEAFSKVSAEKEEMVEHFRNATAKFAAYIRRPDDKQSVIQAFQSSFNSVEQDMRFDDRTMEELHRRVDEVQASLWEVSEKREEEALEELTLIKTEDWVEDHTTALQCNFMHMLQLEVDAAHCLSSTLNTHHAALQNGGVLPGPAPVSEDDETGGNSCADISPTVADLYVTAEAKAEAEAAAEGGKKGKGKGKDTGEEGFEPDPSDPYPSLTITYMNALKLAGEAGAAEIKALGGSVEEEDAKGGKGGKAAKGKGKGKDKGEEEAPAELSEEAKVLQKRLATQNEILVRRLRRLRKYGEATLDELAIFAQSSYARFSETITNRVQAEATCISALSAVARDAIEKKETLPFHLTVDHGDLYRFPLLLQLDQDTDLTLDSGVRLMPEAAPPPTPIVEAVDEAGVSFSRDQLSDLQEQLQLLASCGGAGSRRCDMVVTRTRFAEAMQRFACDDVLLPDKWQELGRAAWTKMAQLFDQTDSGTVDGSEVMEAVADDAAGVLAKISEA